MAKAQHKEDPMNLSKTRSTKNIVELKKILGDQGCEMNIVYVDDEPFVTIGYVSEADKEACLRAIQTALDTSENKYQAMQKLTCCGMLTHENIDPDEEIMVDDVPIMISYSNKTAYFGTTKIADLDDLNLPSVGHDTIKTLLTDRARLYIASEQLRSAYEYEDDCDDYEDYE